MKIVAELNETDFDPLLATEGTPAVVDFYAPWCGPCKMIAPLLDSLAEHYSGRIRFYKVNVDESPGLADRFQITGVPTLIFLKEGQVFSSIVGFPPPQELVAKLHALTSRNAPEVRA